MSDQETSDMDKSTLSQITNVSESGYEGDTEQNELNNFFEKGIITGVRPDSPEGEVPAENEEKAKEEEDINTQASQAVEDLEILIQEEVEQLSSIDEEPIAKRKAVRSLKPIQRYEPIITIKSKTPKKKVIPLPVSKDTVSSLEANNFLMEETGSQKSAAKVLIVKNVRLETRKPDDQAKVIYGADFKMPEYCYLCVCLLSERVSAKHNERWGYDLNAITSSYDHTAPVNFSSIVSRIPSQYNTNPDKTTINKIEDWEKEYLKSNGKYACFHCNFTKSQMMFITCKVENNVINFQKFKPNDKAIENFVNELYKNNTEWSKDPDGNNTLHKCIRKYHNSDKESWKQKCIKSITDSAQEVCNMIKKHVDQKSVIKRFYYTKLLIQEAYKQLETDPVYLALPPEKKPIYSKKYIAHVIAKAEATNPNYGKPWNSIQINIDKRQIAYNQELQPETQPAVKRQAVRLPSGEVVVPTPIKTPYQKQQESIQRLSRSKRGRSRRRRKTYRRIRLF